MSGFNPVNKPAAGASSPEAPTRRSTRGIEDPEAAVDPEALLRDARKKKAPKVASPIPESSAASPVPRSPELGSVSLTPATPPRRKRHVRKDDSDDDEIVRSPYHRGTAYEPESPAKSRRSASSNPAFRAVPASIQPQPEAYVPVCCRCMKALFGDMAARGGPSANSDFKHHEDWTCEWPKGQYAKCARCASVGRSGDKCEMVPARWRRACNLLVRANFFLTSGEDVWDDEESFRDDYLTLLRAFCVQLQAWQRGLGTKSVEQADTDDFERIKALRQSFDSGMGLYGPQPPANEAPHELAMAGLVDWIRDRVDGGRGWVKQYYTADPY